MFVCFHSLFLLFLNSVALFRPRVSLSGAVIRPSVRARVTCWSPLFCCCLFVFCFFLPCVLCDFSLSRTAGDSHSVSTPLLLCFSLVYVQCPLALRLLLPFPLCFWHIREEDERKSAAEKSEPVRGLRHINEHKEQISNGPYLSVLLGRLYFRPNHALYRVPSSPYP